MHTFDSFTCGSFSQQICPQHIFSEALLYGIWDFISFYLFIFFDSSQVLSYVYAFVKYTSQRQIHIVGKIMIFILFFFLHTEGMPPNGIWISIHICMNWLSLRKNGRVRPLAAQQNMKMAIFYSAVVPDDFKMDIQFIWSYNWTLDIFYSVIKQ